MSTDNGLLVSPSILAADLLQLHRDISRMREAGCDLLHIDLMDPHFVPNMSFSPALVKAIHRDFPDMKLDVHLMLSEPEQFLEELASDGAWGITIHAEINGDPAAALKKIHELGVRTGLALRPGTPVSAICDLLPETDMVLVMTVEPGFGGQKFQPAMMEKLTELRKLGYQGLIESDGGLTMDNLPMMAEHGLNVAVMGTAMYRSADPAADIRRIHEMRVY